MTFQDVPVEISHDGQTVRFMGASYPAANLGIQSSIKAFKERNNGNYIEATANVVIKNDTLIQISGIH